MYKHNYILYIIKSIIINMQHPALKAQKVTIYLAPKGKTLYVVNALIIDK